MDLRTLFKEGVCKSDVLVILATKGVFTRPWCLMEMWEAARAKIPIVLFPVVGGGFDLADVRHLLGSLSTEMHARNPTCLAEVMAHVKESDGVTDVREVEDVLLAHIGLVPSLARDGRPVPSAHPAPAHSAHHHVPLHAAHAMHDAAHSAQHAAKHAGHAVSHAMHEVATLAAHTLPHHHASHEHDAPHHDDEAARAASQERLGSHLDHRLAAHLGREAAALAPWLQAHNTLAEERLQFLQWQSWGSDNGIIASVQTLLDETATALGREKLVWEEGRKQGVERSSASEGSVSDRSSACEGSVSPLSNKLLPKGWPFGKSIGSSAKSDGILMVLDAEECAGAGRLLQQQLSLRLGCDAILCSDSIDAWRREVQRASRGVLLLQTRSVLRHPVRLLQIFDAVARRKLPVVCVMVQGGGYDFAATKPLLQRLPSELKADEVAALREQLAMDGDGMGQLARTLSKAVPNAISVFFNPAGKASAQDAAVIDMIDKLDRSAALAGQLTGPGSPTAKMKQATRGSETRPQLLLH